MTGVEDCGKAMIVQAAIDGELDAMAMAEIESHWASCAACADLRDTLQELSRRVRTEADYRAMPEDFRQSLLARLKIDEGRAPAPRSAPRPPRWFHGIWKAVAGFGAGAAVATASILMLMVPAPPGLTDLVVADHVRALQPGHLLDVASNNQHNVRPWFNGRIDFAPPVKNLTDAGFPLIGGRLDYLNGRVIAVLVYQRRLHPIEMLVWPAPGAGDSEPVRFEKSGYTLYHWTAGGMTIWVISDLIDPELGEFVAVWRK